MICWATPARVGNVSQGLSATCTLIPSSASLTSPLCTQGIHQPQTGCSLLCSNAAHALSACAQTNAQTGPDLRLPEGTRPSLGLLVSSSAQQGVPLQGICQLRQHGQQERHCCMVLQGQQLGQDCLEALGEGQRLVCKVPAVQCYICTCFVQGRCAFMLTFWEGQRLVCKSPAVQGYTRM